MMRSRKPDAKKIIVTVKFQAPDVARPTRSRLPPPNLRPLPLLGSADGPNFTAATTMRGSATMRRKAMSVRLRRSCLMSSTRSGSVALAR